MTTAIPDPAPARSAPGRLLRTLLGAPFAAATWRAFTYALLSVVLGMVGLVYFSAGIGLLVTVIGIPLAAAMILGARAWGHLYRSTGRGLLGTRVQNPPPFQAPGDVRQKFGSALTDRVGWRSLTFLGISSVTSLTAGVVAVGFAAFAVGLLISPILWPVIDPVNIGPDGTEHHSLVQFGDTYIDTWPQVIAASAIGLICCFIAPWPIRGFAAVQSRLTRFLLGP